MTDQISRLLSGHQFVLGANALNRSISRVGHIDALAPVMGRLLRGMPITIGQLGASVGQDGGCLAQPYRRCHDFSGTVRTKVQWGRPISRKFKGYLVRFFEELNSTWPHAAHRLNNSAADAQVRDWIRRDRLG